MTEGPVKAQRAYDNTRRAAQARRTRRDVLDATYRLLLDQGYAGTTVTAIARAAGVSVETIYKAFGTKAALVKEVYDVTLVGDDEPVPLTGRPEFQALMAERDPRRKLAHYAHIGRVIIERLGPLYSVLLAGARSGEEELRHLVATTDAERLAGTGALTRHLADAGSLRPGLSVERAHDILWTLTSVDVYRLLVTERGWPLDDYERWLAITMQDAILGPLPA
ncbi:MAG: TetR/AcrR family transcriptional regulator [Egibacteraceae bacterium]